MNPVAGLIAQLSIYGAIVFVLAATVFAFTWSYYSEVLKESGSDRDTLLARLRVGGFPRAFYIDFARFTSI
jgi:FlaG/FlaF family flagellin (archaellin)